MIMIAINERLQLWPLTTSPCSLLYPPVNCNYQPLSYAGMAMLTARSLRCNNHFLVLVVAAAILFLLLLPHSSLAIRTTHSDRVDFQFTNSTADSNVSLSTTSRQGSFADIIDRALQHEFNEENDDQNQQGNHKILIHFLQCSSWFLLNSRVTIQQLIFRFNLI